jgi:hypothetical protein
MDDLTTLLSYVGTFFIGATPMAVLAGILAKPWIEKRIEFSISHEYEKKLADYQNKLAQAEARQDEQRELRYRAALIADLMATWLCASNDREKLNRLSFEAFLWLPQEIATDVSNALAHKPGAPSVREMIVKVRKHLLGQDDSLPATDVIIFRSTPANSSPSVSYSIRAPRATIPHPSQFRRAGLDIYPPEDPDERRPT